MPCDGQLHGKLIFLEQTLYIKVTIKRKVRPRLTSCSSVWDLKGEKSQFDYKYKFFFLDNLIRLIWDPDDLGLDKPGYSVFALV